MPFLARTDYGGPFKSYQTALSNLNSSFVRMAPWCPNPRMVVPELTPPDCNYTVPAYNWNSTILDAVMHDFMGAVCGPDAVDGQCRLSVIMQISTLPSWLYVDGMKLSDVPENAYVPTRPPGHKAYEAGGALRDPTCQVCCKCKYRQSRCLLPCIPYAKHV